MTENTQIAPQNTNEVARNSEDTQRRATVTPAVDIVEDSHGITLWADLPGVPREKLDVKVHDARLTIEAEAELPVQGAVRVHHAELRAPRFARAFTVSDDFDTTKIDANLTNGVLKLTIPRREEARPRRVEVRAG
ncbi:heat-shock protein [Burkholderia sp. SFA1]|uniref:Hsp20/alpha crystallin family protein n=1 Tax=unclassified Caballeronia TaxID=2646786 RepID=UPI001F23E056|nr:MULTISPECIES: Hsp20/alpha crystallin family protein [unclassified Caballeronia]MCE4544980.1 Hsp20/alpha crystallin family protein [Caballeronia sp. PC1]MCE4570404.1 Hsp20/alpha crystallin family protein [Caballeronia sp. CLC5]BBP98241.1 heat-shock protein [Burkholderia sp. SFA1]